MQYYPLYLLLYPSWCSYKLSAMCSLCFSFSSFNFPPPTLYKTILGHISREKNNGLCAVPLSQVLNWSWWPGELLIKNNKIQTFTSITITKGKNYKPVLIQAFLPPRTNERNSLFESLQIRALSTSVLVRTGKLIYSVILWVIITTYNMLLTHQVIGMVLVKVLYSYICTGYHPKVDLRWSNWTVRCGTMWTRNIMARHWMSWMVF